MHKWAFGDRCTDPQWGVVGTVTRVVPMGSDPQWLDVTWDPSSLRGDDVVPHPDEARQSPPEGAPRAVDLIAEVLHDAFKGNTDVDLDMLAAEAVDALQGKALTVELRWHDGYGWGNDEGVFVLGRIDESSAGRGS